MTMPVPDGLLLVVEAATAAGSLALLECRAGRCGGVRASCAVPMGSGRTDVLTPALTQLLQDAGAELSAVVAVLCGAGPGSFTSLRIAGSFAKGLGYGLDVPLYAVPSLLLAVGDGDSAPAAGEYRVALDALRSEVYLQDVRVDAHGLIEPSGPPARVAVATLSAESVRMVNVTTGIVPHASNARWLRDWSAFGPVPLDTWEPAYGRLAEAQVKWEASHGRALRVD